jgi:hypothetical protein
MRIDVVFFETVPGGDILLCNINSLSADNGNRFDDLCLRIMIFMWMAITVLAHPYINHKVEV